MVDEFEEVASCKDKIFKIFWRLDLVVALVEVEDDFGNELWERPMLFRDLKRGGDFRIGQYM